MTDKYKFFEEGSILSLIRGNDRPLYRVSKYDLSDMIKEDIEQIANNAYQKGIEAGRRYENNLLSKALYPREYREK